MNSIYDLLFVNKHWSKFGRIDSGVPASINYRGRNKRKRWRRNEKDKR